MSLLENTLTLSLRAERATIETNGGRSARGGSLGVARLSLPIVVVSSLVTTILFGRAGRGASPASMQISNYRMARERTTVRRPRLRAMECEGD